MQAPTSKGRYHVPGPYAAIHWLNDDILLSIFNCYRLDNEYSWNHRPGWCKLSHVCTRWRHIIYECTSHLGMHIECTNGFPILGTLEHLPLLPLFLKYNSPITGSGRMTLPEQDELGIYHALRFHGRVRHIDLNLPASILHKVLVLIDGHFPILEHLSLSCAAKNSITLTLPKAFLAPNLRHLTLPGIGTPRRLRVLTSTVSLVTLVLGEIETSSYFRPRLLVARLQSLPHLEELSIDFSIPIPRPSTEKALLGERGAPVTLSSLKKIGFKGVGAYLEFLIAQIRAPHLEWLDITLFNQIAFALPHLSYLINTTEAFKLPSAEVVFHRNTVHLTTHPGSEGGPFSFHVICKQLDWQIDCAAQICHALIPALSGVEKIMLYCSYSEIPTELQNGEIDSITWHELLRSFIGVKELYIPDRLLEELSLALQVDEVGSDPGFLPNLRSVNAKHNLLTSFIDTRQVMGRPVQFVEWSQWDLY
jgi:hypothetical protein